MSKLLYDKLYELTINFDRHQFINLLMQKDRKIQDLSTDKQQLNMLVNSCQNEIRKLKEQNERLLELCMYALIASTKIYNHELANDTKKLFIDIIKNNLNYDTYILKNKLLEAWRSDK